MRMDREEDNVTISEIRKYLEDHQDPRGIANWDPHKEASGGLGTYGVGLTKLRKYAKSIGRDAELARQLWQQDLYEMRILSLLVDDPKAITMEQAESQVEHLNGGHLAHVFSSCDATLAKTPFVVEIADKWVNSDDPVRRSCGYGLLYEISKKKTKSAPDEAYFQRHIAQIGDTYAAQPMNVLMAMASALMGIGKRSRILNAQALEVAQRIGPIDFDPDGRCDPLDVVKHLTSDYLRKKLGI